MTIDKVAFERHLKEKGMKLCSSLGEECARKRKALGSSVYLVKRKRPVGLEEVK